MDVTCWLAWFLGCLLRVIEGADATVGAVRGKSQFWQRWSGVALNERQIRLLNRLLDGFDGKLTSGKRAAIAKCSADTALRDINDLLAKGPLVKSSASGRSTHYELAEYRARDRRVAVASVAFFSPSVAEGLRHHQPVSPAVQDADADAPERRVQDVGAVAR